MDNEKIMIKNKPRTTQMKKIFGHLWLAKK